MMVLPPPLPAPPNCGMAEAPHHHQCHRSATLRSHSTCIQFNADNCARVVLTHHNTSRTSYHHNKGNGTNELVDEFLDAAVDSNHCWYLKVNKSKYV